jgi:hypothetical protein
MFVVIIELVNEVKENNEDYYTHLNILHLKFGKYLITKIPEKMIWGY